MTANIAITPIWDGTKISYTQLGGDPNLHNLGNQDNVDPETQVDARKYQALTVVASQASYTMWFVNMIVQTNDATSAAPTVTAYESVFGNGVGAAPSLSRVSNGIFTITFSATKTDDFGQVASVSFKQASLTVETSTASVYHLAYSFDAPNVVRVRIQQLISGSYATPTSNVRLSISIK